MSIEQLIFVGLNGYVAALHRETGELIWTNDQLRSGYVTLLLLRRGPPDRLHQRVHLLSLALHGEDPLAQPDGGSRGQCTDHGAGLGPRPEQPGADLAGRGTAGGGGRGGGRVGGDGLKMYGRSTAARTHRRTEASTTFLGPTQSGRGIGVERGGVPGS